MLRGQKFSVSFTKAPFAYYQIENLLLDEIAKCLHAYTKLSLTPDRQVITIFAAYIKPTLSLHKAYTEPTLSLHKNGQN